MHCHDRHLRRFARFLWVLVPVCSGLGACLWSTDEPYLGRDVSEPIQVLSHSPAAGQEGVPTNAGLTFFFDDAVHPDSVSGDTIWLSAGGTAVGASRRVDLLDCSVTLRPHAPLQPLLTHRAEAAGLWGFFTSPLAEPIAVGFTTGDATTALPVDPLDPPTLDDLVTGVFADRCASCHSAHLPPGGVDLSSVEGAAASLVGRQSELWPGATRVVPGSHARSYLFWKLLGLPAVFGDPMPPEGDWPLDRGCGTADADLRRIAAWIDSL